MNICRFAIRYIVFSVLLIVYCHSADAKVLMITHSYNRPDFIEIQARTFKKFLLDDYEFVVFNDAPQEDMTRRISETCSNLGIACIRIPQTIHAKPYLARNPNDDYQNPAVRCANVVQYSLDVLGFDYDGIVAIIDADMFPIKEFSIHQYLEGYQLAGVPQKRAHIDYIWNGLVFFNMNDLPDKHSIDFNCLPVEGIAVDVGGNVYSYLRSHPEVKVAKIGNEYINEWTALTPRQEKHDHIKLLFELGPNNIEFLLNYSFLHYRSGTNWDARSTEYHKTKTQILNLFLSKILE